MANYNVYPDLSKRSPHGAMQNNLRELLHALEAEAAIEAAEEGPGAIDGLEGDGKKRKFVIIFIFRTARVPVTG